MKATNTFNTIAPKVRIMLSRKSTLYTHGVIFPNGIFELRGDTVLHGGVILDRNECYTGEFQITCNNTKLVIDGEEFTL